MWLFRKQAREINERLAKIKEERDNALSSVKELQAKVWSLSVMIENRDAKIRNQMEGLQALNRDLDAWEPVANLVHSMMDKNEAITFTTADMALEYLKKYRKIRDERESADL